MFLGVFETENRNLLNIMEKCGHFLYHRRGVKRGQFMALRILSQHDGITQTELSKLLTIRSGSLSETVKKLESKGFIVRKKSEDDKRRMLLSITDEGRHFMQKQRDLWREQEEKMFTGLSDEEKAELTALLEKLLSHWESEFEEELFICEKRENKCGN